MSHDSLSQQEIDLLFSGGEPAVVAAAPVRERRVDVQVYDFRRPNLVSKDRMRALDAMYGLLTKSLEGWLTAKVRGQTEVTLVAVEQLSYGEFVLSLPNPCASYVFDIGETGQQAVIDFGNGLAFFLVDRLLGSSGAPLLQPRGLTPLERMIVRLVADRVSEQLQEVWHDHVTLPLRLSRFESIPDMLQTSSREEPMLVAHLEVAAAGIQSPLMICLPFAVLERFFTQGGLRRVRAAAAQRNELEARMAEQLVRGVGVQLAARFPAFAVPLRALRTLHPGSTLLAPFAPDARLVLFAEGSAFAEGEAGRADANLAVSITQLLPIGGRNPQPRRTRVATMPLGGAAGAALDDDAPEGGQLSTLLHLSLPVTIELGRTRMSVQEILELGRGSVVQLERLVGEPVDVIVGDRHFAEGEVVVIGEQFGVRITKLTQAEGSRA